VRKGAGTDLCESKESRMPSQLSRRRAILEEERKREGGVVMRVVRERIDKNV